MLMRRIVPVLTLSCVLGILPFSGAVDDAFAQIRASDVRDRETLRAFVERARIFAAPSVARATKAEAYDFFNRHFWPEGEWKHRSIYLFVLDAEGADRGVTLFHGAQRRLDNVNQWEGVDINGVKYVQELARVSLAGGGYVDYLFDDPAVMGDEELGSPKVGYATVITIGGDRYFIGSGIYPGSIPIAPPLAQLLLALLLAGGGVYFRRRRA